MSVQLDQRLAVTRQGEKRSGPMTLQREGVVSAVMRWLSCSLSSADRDHTAAGFGAAEIWLELALPEIWNARYAAARFGDDAEPVPEPGSLLINGRALLRHRCVCCAPFQPDAPGGHKSHTP